MKLQKETVCVCVVGKGDGKVALHENDPPTPLASASMRRETTITISCIFALAVVLVHLRPTCKHAPP